MTVPDVDVRIATEADAADIADVLAAAFADYPFTRHTIAADDHADRLRRGQELFVREVGLPHGEVWVTGDGDAASVWTGPGFVTAAEVFGRLGPRLAEIAGDRAAQSERVERALQPYRPRRPVWFLGSVGVRPGRQGRGLGTAVIAPGLAAADADGVPAFLETSLPGNVEFYRRLGFEVTAEVMLPDDGPVTWAMERPAR